MDIKETFIEKTLLVIALSSITILALITFFIFEEGLPLIWKGGPRAFILGDRWVPSQGSFGIFPMIVSSFWVTLGALLLGIPLGLACTIFLCALTPPSLGLFLKPDRRGTGRAYSLDEKSSVAVTDKEITIPFTQIGSVSDAGMYSIRGNVKEVKEPRSFTSRNGTASWVRNILVNDGSDDIKVVVWGEKALLPIQPGEQVEVYHAAARAGRYGGIELSVGAGSSIRIPKEESLPIYF